MRHTPAKRVPAKRVSLVTIADHAGVSVSTVSRIANGQLNRANAETVARIQLLLSTLGYRPDSIGRSLRNRESRVIAMLAPNLNNPAMAAIASSTEAALRQAGYVMILCDTHDEPALQDEYLEAMRAQSVQGYIVVSAVQSPILADFIDTGEPVILVGRRRHSSLKPAPFVGIDNLAAGALAADFLLDAGIDEPAVIHTSLASSAIADRLLGFMSRLKQRGISSRKIRQASSKNLQHLSAGYESVQALVADSGWPEGLFCVSDLMAYGAYRYAIETGRCVPEQSLLVGIDDSPLNAWIAPWLSSVHIPYAEYGEVILEQLKAIWADETPVDRLLPHRLVTRRPFAREPTAGLN